MNTLIQQCHDYLKNCDFSYAFCGGYALELFLNKQIRTQHSDVDISIFDKDRKSVVNFLLKRGWGIFQATKINPDFKGGLVKQIKSADDESVLNVHCLWAIKSDCTTFKTSQQANSDIFNFEIINKHQHDFDYIEIIFDSISSGYFVCDKNMRIKRALNKAIMHVDEIPYLSPELILFFKSPPAYLESSYQREKCQSDFYATVPFLPIESREWLARACETAFPDGHEWLEKLRNERMS